MEEFSFVERRTLLAPLITTTIKRKRSKFFLVEKRLGKTHVPIESRD